MSPGMDRLDALMRAHRVNAYFTGHHHNLQHITTGGPMHYVVSGAGSRLSGGHQKAELLANKEELANKLLANKATLEFR
jgi:hypothetical protein